MLRYPRLILDSVPGAIPNVPGVNQSRTAAIVGRSNVTVYSWHTHAYYKVNPHERGTVKHKGSPIPQYISAYLQLLAATHPTHKIRWVSECLASPYPALVVPSKETVLEWRREQGVYADDIVAAFSLNPDANKHHSVQAIGNDPVRGCDLQR
jgi:hypothetical protein